jgi:YcaO-like protein with predicted kinase domain
VSDRFPAQVDERYYSPVYFRGTPLRSNKSFTQGTHRAKLPEETFDVVHPYLAEAGITRVADITGLDNVGVPTTLAIRPNGITIACSSGKGLTMAAALVSGAMEAIELHAAENVALPSIRGSYNEIASQYLVPSVEDFPFSLNGIFSVDWPLDWYLGWDVLLQSEIALPLVMVGMGHTRSLISSLGAFVVSSNGLGAGNTFLEAVNAGLYEVIERDSVACHCSARLRGNRTPVLPDSILRSYPLVAQLLDLCATADVRILVLDCTADTGVPTFEAYVYNRTSAGPGVLKGYGTHLDTEVAVVRAITEALQGRLNFIAGARDDVFRAAFWRVRGGASRSLTAALERLRTNSPEATRRPSRAADCFESDIHHLLTCLRTAGLTHVIVFDITPAGCPISVVRIVVPGLETYRHDQYRPGRRAKNYAIGGGS